MRAGTLPTPWREETIMTSPPQALSEPLWRCWSATSPSAQADAFIYTNLIERLKGVLNDTIADQVIEQMRTLGCRSADWSPESAAPPRHRRPKAIQEGLGLAFRELAEVGKFLLDCVNFVMATPSGGVSRQWQLGSLCRRRSTCSHPKTSRTPLGGRRHQDFVDKGVMTELGKEFSCWVRRSRMCSNAVGCLCVGARAAPPASNQRVSVERGRSVRLAHRR